MRLVFTERGWEEYQWFNENNRPLFKRLNLLIKECLRTPFEGLGKPEKLKNELSGYWSKRIDQEHRLVYFVDGSDFVIYSCRHHYSK